MTDTGRIEGGFRCSRCGGEVHGNTHVCVAPHDGGEVPMTREMDSLWAASGVKEAYSRIEALRPTIEGCIEREKKLEAELAAWREVGAELEWCVYDTDKKEGFIRICPSCHGKYDKHKPDCKLAKLLRRE